MGAWARSSVHPSITSISGDMSTNPIDSSIVQTAQAQVSASKARDRERAASERTRRFEDQVELRVAGMESAEAVRKLPQNDSEQAEDEHQREGREPDKKGGIDIKA